jgi:hypothetical protein
MVPDADVPVDTGISPDAAAAAILSFTASPQTISASHSSTLIWSVTGAETLVIDQGIGSVMGTTSILVTPSATTTYTLTLNGSVSAQVKVTVVPPPAIARFDADPVMIDSGGGTTLTGVFSGGDGTVDHGVGGLTSNTGKSIGPITASTTYTLTVTNTAGDSTTAQVTVAVLQGIFVATDSMATPRLVHTATLLPNGKVLIAGGVDDNVRATVTATAELYDPGLGKFAATGSMTVPRRSHVAALLQNGKVLVAGGIGTGEAIASADLYDPAGGTFTATGDMTSPRLFCSATLLQNGKVLVAGGLVGVYPTGTYLKSAELYDPVARTFTATGSMTEARGLHVATLLANGKVLVTGGYGADYLQSAELYDPVAGTFTATVSMAASRWQHAGALLANGKALVAGGHGSGGETASAELFDPVTEVFTTTGSMKVIREQQTATLLPNGKMLIAGGFNATSGPLASAELYDPVARTFSATGTMTAAREYTSATLLPNHMVLVVGGCGSTGNSLASAELFK